MAKVQSIIDFVFVSTQRCLIDRNERGLDAHIYEKKKYVAVFNSFPENSRTKVDKSFTDIYSRLLLCGRTRVVNAVGLPRSGAWVTSIVQ